MEENISCINLCFVGAGQVNFGGGEGPWDHSLRLSQYAKNNKNIRLKVLGIADPDTERAKYVLNKMNKIDLLLYNNCKIYNDWKIMIDELLLNNLHCVIIGSPPNVRGSNQYNIELYCVQNGLDIFVEKPISVEQPIYFDNYLNSINSCINKIKSKYNNNRNPIISVGYMFRYHPAINKIKEILNNFNKPILHINLRYECAYPYLNKPFWWDDRTSGGPIVEQATHFIDISRFIGGDIDLDSIQGMSIKPPNPIAKLSNYPKEVIDANIPIEYNIPIMTTALWKYKVGGLGVLAHGVHLHHKNYQSYIDIWCDGLQLLLINPYEKLCKLLIRITSNDINIPCKEEILQWDTSLIQYDCYYSELNSFFNSIQQNNNLDAKKYIRCDYNDAAQTYKTTWYIKYASSNKNKL